MGDNTSDCERISLICRNSVWTYLIHITNLDAISARLVEVYGTINPTRFPLSSQNVDECGLSSSTWSQDRHESTNRQMPARV